MEVRTTALAVWEGGALDLYCHAEQLPPPPAQPVAVEVRGSPRSAAAAKVRTLCGHHKRPARASAPARHSSRQCMPSPDVHTCAQDSAWVTERKGLEELRGADVDEVILCGDGGELLEGSQTNFYALQDGALWTASDGVLAGTVRNLVLRAPPSPRTRLPPSLRTCLPSRLCAARRSPYVASLSATLVPRSARDGWPRSRRPVRTRAGLCEQHGVELVLRPPNLSELHTWDGCLISSTSRLLLPVDSVRVCREGSAWDRAVDTCRSFDTGDGSQARRLADLLSKEVEGSSGELPC